MDSRYVKTALALVIISILLITAIFVTVLISVNNASCLMPAAQSSTCEEEQAIALTEQFIKNTSTFAFDGIEGSIKKLKIESADGGNKWKLTYVFKCKHPGYGDRSDQSLAEVITRHSALVTIQDCRIIAATCDRTYDLLTDKQIK